MNRRRYSDAERGAVLLSLLLGNSVRWTAREHRIPLGTVKKWSARWAPFLADTWRAARTGLANRTDEEPRKNSAAVRTAERVCS